MTPATYRALQIAGERIGENNYRRQKTAHLKSGRKMNTFRFVVSDAHKRVVDAMGSYGITDEEAMSILWEHDVFEERFPS